MHETPDDLRELQRVLDESYALAGEHLRSNFTPDRRMSAEDVAEMLQGVFILNLATVTASGDPIVAPIDGLFYRGHVWFSVPPRAARVRHLRSRPQVSATHTRGEDECVIVHGTAREVDLRSPEHAGFRDYLREVYGLGPEWDKRIDSGKNTGLTAWIEPRRMYAGVLHD